MLRVARSLDASLDQQAQEYAGAYVRPGQQLPLFAPGGPQDNIGLQTLLPTWGYVASWNNKLVYNTRIESAASSMWASSFAYGRAVVCAQHFFEPHKSETWRNPITGRLGKRSYVFSNPDGTPLLLGAVYQNGCASIVTTQPNASVAPVHNRMPLVLRFEEVGTWLSDSWPALADRTSVALDAAPEHENHGAFNPGNPPNEQLALF